MVASSVSARSDPRGPRLGELYIAEFSSEIVGTLVPRWEDPMDWGERPPAAGYLDSLSVRQDEPCGGSVGGGAVLGDKERHGP